jgi:hypothetical protein
MREKNTSQERPFSGRQSLGARRSGAVTASAATVLAAAAFFVVGSGTAHAATAPTAQLSLSPSTITAGTQPQLTFLSSNAPSGALFVLQESTDGGAQWNDEERTNQSAGTSDLAAEPEGIYDFRIVITDGNTVVATSAPATLTVTGADGATPPPAPAATVTPPAPTSTPITAPSTSETPWMKFIVEPIWHAIIDVIIGWILALF